MTLPVGEVAFQLGHAGGHPPTGGVDAVLFEGEDLAARAGVEAGDLVPQLGDAGAGRGCRCVSGDLR